MTVVFEKQQQSNWCWATCVRMVALAAGSTPPEQCAIVSRMLGVSDCCTNGASEACNKPLDAKRIPQLYSGFALVAEPLAPGAPVAEPVVRKALQAGPVVQLLLDLGTTYHYMLLTGTTPAGYAVVDPLYGAFTDTWASISTGYDQGGALSAAWRVHPR